MKVQVHVVGHRSGEPIEVPLVLNGRYVEFSVPGGPGRAAKCSFDLELEDLSGALAHLTAVSDAALVSAAQKPSGGRAVTAMRVEPKEKAAGKVGS